MIILVGASASGKTELAKILYQTYGYKKCITTTTRSPRLNEKDGRDYHFVSDKAFDQLIAFDAFVEVNTYHEHRYGLQKKDIHDKGIVILDPNGANNLVKVLKQDAYVVYVASSKQVRKARMIARLDDPAKIDERLKMDDQYYQIGNLDKVNLKIVNQDTTLKDLANNIYLAHQAYLKDNK